jgi:membrane-bound lytic murein transglycosylase B
MTTRRIFQIILLITIILNALYAWATQPPRQMVAARLVGEGIDPLQAQSLLDESITAERADIILNNMFHSSPRESRPRSGVMEISPRQIERAAAFMRENETLLTDVERRFGVSPRIITAILLIESRLGTYPMPYNVVTVYANLAFLDDPDYLRAIQQQHAENYPQLLEEAAVARAKRKAKWAIGELVFLIRLANHLGMDPTTITGSFAGAMGPAQFIPSSFWIFGLDADGDGLASPFNMADATMSMGNYLRKYGWREDAPLAQKRRALWYYNRSEVYVNTVLMIYDALEREGR